MSTKWKTIVWNIAKQLKTIWNGSTNDKWVKLIENLLLAISGKHVYWMKNKNKCWVSLDIQFSNFLFLKLDFIKILLTKKEMPWRILCKKEERID